jgi:hypothetical protein
MKKKNPVWESFYQEHMIAWTEYLQSISEWNYEEVMNVPHENPNLQEELWRRVEETTNNLNNTNEFLDEEE